MELLEAMSLALQAVFSWQSLLWMIGGVLIGIVLGPLPGLGGTVTLALLIPFTYGMNPTIGFSFLLGAHVAITFGGAVSAILFSVPGTPQNVATCFEGYRMSQKGQSARAIGAQGMSSCIGGIFGALLLGISIPIIRPFMLALGPPEYFMLVVMGLTIISLLTAGNLRKGLIAAGLGMSFSFIGMDAVTGTARYTFGQLSLYGGFDFVAVVLGMFAIAAMIELIAKGGSITQAETFKNMSTVTEGVKDAFKNLWLIIRCSVIGSLVGLTPGIGGTTANVLAYGYAKVVSKHPEEWGNGCVEGVIGPEASANATEGSNLIPTVAFGIPSSESMAILLGAFIMMGLSPGPIMMRENLDIVFSLVYIIALANVFCMIIGFSFANQMQKLTKISGNHMFPVILIICAVAAFATFSDFTHVVVAFTFGAIGYIFKKLNISRAAFIIAMVLGPVAERYYHVALRAFGPTFILQRPVCIVIAIICLLIIAWPFIQSWRGKRRIEGVDGL